MYINYLLIIDMRLANIRYLLIIDDLRYQIKCLCKLYIIDKMIAFFGPSSAFAENTPIVPSILLSPLPEGSQQEEGKMFKV